MVLVNTTLQKRRIRANKWSHSTSALMSNSSSSPGVHPPHAGPILGPKKTHPPGSIHMDSARIKPISSVWMTLLDGSSWMGWMGCWMGSPSSTDPPGLVQQGHPDQTFWIKWLLMIHKTILSRRRLRLVLSGREWVQYCTQLQNSFLIPVHTRQH